MNKNKVIVTAHKKDKGLLFTAAHLLRRVPRFQEKGIRVEYNKQDKYLLVHNISEKDVSNFLSSQKYSNRLTVSAETIENKLHEKPEEILFIPLPEQPAHEKSTEPVKNQALSVFMKYVDNIQLTRSLRNAYIDLNEECLVNDKDKRTRFTLEECTDLIGIFHGSESEAVLGFFYDEHHAHEKKDYLLNHGNLNRVKKELANPFALTEEENQKRHSYMLSLEGKVKTFETEKRNYTTILKTKINTLKNEMKNFEVPLYAKTFDSGNIGVYIKIGLNYHQIANIASSDNQKNELEEVVGQISDEMKNRYNVSVELIEIRDQERRAKSIRNIISDAILQELNVAGKPLTINQISSRLKSYDIPFDKLDLYKLARKGQISKIGDKRGAKYASRKTLYRPNYQ